MFQRDVRTSTFTVRHNIMQQRSNSMSRHTAWLSRKFDVAPEFCTVRYFGIGPGHPSRIRAYPAGSPTVRRQSEMLDCQIQGPGLQRSVQHKEEDPSQNQEYSTCQRRTAASRMCTGPLPLLSCSVCMTHTKHNEEGPRQNQEYNTCFSGT